jgi:3-methyladenine DNA glycosylase/8-oxoguanine DNA glycosylase
MLITDILLIFCLNAQNALPITDLSLSNAINLTLDGLPMLQTTEDLADQAYRIEPQLHSYLLSIVSVEELLS